MAFQNFSSSEYIAAKTADEAVLIVSSDALALEQTQINPESETTGSAPKLPAILTVPNEITFNICLCLPGPADALALSITCKALNTILGPSKESNRFWFEFLNTTARYEKAIQKYKSWSDKDLDELRNRLCGTYYPSYPSKDALFMFPETKYWRNAPYRERCLTKVKEKWRHPYCSTCLLTFNSNPLPEFKVQPFETRHANGYFGGSPHFCERCISGTLQLCEDRPYCNLDLSKLRYVLWPDALTYLQSIHECWKQYPAGKSQKVFDALFGPSTFGAFSLSRKKKDSRLYYRSEVKKALKEQYGLTEDEYPHLARFQNVLFWRLKKEIMRLYGKKHGNSPTQDETQQEIPVDTSNSSERGYTFNREGILDNDAVQTFLDEEWNEFKCSWGVADTCEAVISSKQKRWHVKTINEHEYSNIFEDLHSPPAAGDPESPEFSEWLIESAELIVERFLYDPILPLSSENRNEKNFVLNRIWKHGAPRYCKPQSRKVGLCTYCDNGEFYTAYMYAMHLYTDHNFEFYKRSWRWRKKDEFYKEITKNVAVVSTPQAKEDDRFETSIDRSIKHTIYGPSTRWKKGEGVGYDGWGYYYYGSPGAYEEVAAPVWIPWDAIPNLSD